MVRCVLVFEIMHLYGMLSYSIVNLKDLYFVDVNYWLMEVNYIGVVVFSIQLFALLCVCITRPVCNIQVLQYSGVGFPFINPWKGSK